MIPVVPVIVIDDLFANIALPGGQVTTNIAGFESGELCTNLLWIIPPSLLGEERLITRAGLGAVLTILLASSRHSGQVHERTPRH